MVFASHAFIVFLSVLLCVYAAGVSRRASLGPYLIIAASLFFYAFWHIAHLPLFLVSIVANFLLGRAIRARIGTGAGKLILTVGVAANLALIGYFKYALFFLTSFSAATGIASPALAIIMPIGISFFTFQQIAYLVDTWRGKVIAHGFRDYIFFISFFPHLIAGPIVAQADLLPQLAERRDWRLKPEQLAVGLALFSVGLFKKTVLIDPFVPYIDAIYQTAAAGQPVAMADAWLGALGYSFQIYFDFSAYSDMAIGLAYLFGFRLPMNFFSPYKAVDIRDFWRRWHMTLSRFLRDYLYIPLGGSRRGLAHTLMAVIATMTLGGLWHGAGWTFILWGLIHGLFLAFNHLTRHFRMQRTGSAEPAWRATVAGHALSVAVTFLAVTLAWVYFRAPDVATAHRIFFAMAGMTDASYEHLLGRGLMPLIPVWLFIVWILPNTAEMFRRAHPSLDIREHVGRVAGGPFDQLMTYRQNWRWAVGSGMVLAIAWFALSNLTPFIYFQF
jgi:D-alanyl-lipoteichoic acid acyltransferase DltB (MBOAT superfamily)